MIDILLVDDDKLMSGTLADIIELKGFRTETATSASEAIEKIKTLNFDCVISDIKMPGKNGVDLFNMIKEINPELPVALMTAYARDELVQKGLDQGVIGVFSKPLDLNLIFDFLNYIGSKVKILIIDDDKTFRKTMNDVFHLIGHTDVVICELDEIEKNLTGTSLVMLDVKLPNSSCSEVYKIIRDHSPEVPVVLVTGYQKEMVNEILPILKSNVSGILEKPIERDELKQLLSKVKITEMKKRIYPDLTMNTFKI